MSARQESKFSREELRHMARSALQAKAQNDMRWLQLILACMFRTGLDADHIELEIGRLAA